MADQNISEYISSQLSQGVDRSTITNYLLTNGSTLAEIDTAFNSLNQSTLTNQSTAAVDSSAESTINSAVETNIVAQNSFFKKLLMAVAVFILLAAVASAGYFGFSYLKGNKVTLGEAVINTFEALSTKSIKSGEISLVAKIIVEDVANNYSDLIEEEPSAQMLGQFQNLTFNLEYSGLVNTSKEGNLESSGNLDLSIKNQSIGEDAGTFPDQELALKHSIFFDGSYINIEKVPSLAIMFLPPTVNIEKYLNQWYSLPATLTDAYSQNLVDDEPTTAMSDEDKAKLISLLNDSGAFTVLNQKSEKTAKGTSVTAMYIKIDWDKLGDEFIKLMKEEGGDSYAKSDELELRANIEKIKELGVNNSAFKLLVNSSGLIQGFVSTGDLVDDANKNIGNYNIKLEADSLNKGFTIDRPANARPFTDVMNEISGALGLAM